MEEKISLRAARVNANLTAKAVADMLGISTYSILCWEKGVHSIPAHAFLEMCRIYKRNPSDIFLPDKFTKSKD